MNDDAEEILQATAEAAGMTLTSHALFQENISGDGLVRAFHTDFTDGEGAQHSQLIYLHTSPRGGARDDVLVFRNEETDDEVSVWVYPQDPELPALAPAVYPRAAAVVLGKMGIETDGLSLDLVAYRPGKRAVVRAETEHSTFYLKVVRPKQVEALHELYSLWQKFDLPVPQTLGWSAEGLMGFTALRGVPATDVVEHLGETFLDSLDELAARYARVASVSEARVSLLDRRAWYERRVAARHPELADRAAALRTRIDEIMASVERPNSVTIHGDMHLGQVFVDPADPEDITGVLDIDTAGLGDPADDTGALYAHLRVSAVFAWEYDGADGAARAEAYDRLAAQVRERWGDSAPDPQFSDRARAIAATHLLAHTLGGQVAAETLIAQAEALLA